jgi:hypothetical protein
MQRAALVRSRRYSLDAMVEAYRALHRAMADHTFDHPARAQSLMSEGAPG